MNLPIHLRRSKSIATRSGLDRRVDGPLRATPQEAVRMLPTAPRQWTEPVPLSSPDDVPTIFAEIAARRSGIRALEQMLAHEREELANLEHLLVRLAPDPRDAEP